MALKKFLLTLVDFGPFIFIDNKTNLLMSTSNRHHWQEMASSSVTTTSKENVFAVKLDIGKLVVDLRLVSY